MDKNVMTLLMFLLGAVTIGLVAVALLLDKQYPSPV